MSDFEEAYKKLQSEIDEMRGMLIAIDLMNEMARKNLNSLASAQGPNQSRVGPEAGADFKGAA